MTTFKVGENVTFKMVYEGTFKVLAVHYVPADQIQYDPITQEGGAGHHQWLVIDSPEHTNHYISGKFFEEACASP